MAWTAPYTWTVDESITKALLDAHVRDNERYLKGLDGAVTIEDWQTVLGLGLTDATELTIATGAITATQGYHKVDTEGDAASDDLDTINGGTAGYVLVLRAEDGARTVVVKDGTGNILLPLGDYSIDDAEKVIMLLYDGTNWREIARSGQGSGIDHGALAGLADNDHTQYILHSLATAANDFVVASGAGTYIKKTLAEVKTLLAIAADIATHAALNTGVHSVGANYVAESSVDALDLASHAGRHDWLGDDELDFRAAFLDNSRCLICDWQVADYWTQTTGGTGSISIGLLKAEIKTGATSGGTAHLHTTAGGFLVTGAYIRWKGRSEVSVVNATTTLFISKDGTAAAPDATDEWAGFKVINGRVWAYSCDGVAEESTDTGEDYAINVDMDLILYVVGASQCQFYVGGVLKATHTTRTPGTSAHYIHLHIVNSANANKEYRTMMVDYVV